VRGVPRHRRPLAPVLVLLQVHLPEGWLSCGDDRQRHSPDEARPRRRLHPDVTTRQGKYRTIA
jgi:hypothetical protein